MAKITVPDEQVGKILRENKMDPDDYCVISREEDWIHLRNYDTRDDVIIRKGDRPW